MRLGWIRFGVEVELGLGLGLRLGLELGLGLESGLEFDLGLVWIRFVRFSRAELEDSGISG